MRSNISGTERARRKILSPHDVARRPLQMPPYRLYLRFRIWGSCPPTQKSRFDHVTFFQVTEIFLKVFMARGYGYLAIKGLSQNSDDGNTVKWGLKVVGGVALFRDPPLPVPLDALFMAHVLEVAELIKTLFEWCRYLLPVWSYGGLNFSKAL